VLVRAERERALDFSFNHDLQIPVLALSPRYDTEQAFSTLMRLGFSLVALLAASAVLGSPVTLRALIPDLLSEVDSDGSDRPAATTPATTAATVTTAHSTRPSLTEAKDGLLKTATDKLHGLLDPHATSTTSPMHQPAEKTSSILTAATVGVTTAPSEKQSTAGSDPASSISASASPPQTSASDTGRGGADISSQESSQWKVIGIGIMSVTLIGVVVLLIIFFDKWWAFIRAAFGIQKRRAGSEDLVPDWNRRSWEFKVAQEDGHRYPTKSSLENITQNEKQDNALAAPPTDPFSDNHHLHSPVSPYTSNAIPQPLDPVFHRPSGSDPKHPNLSL